MSQPACKFQLKSFGELQFQRSFKFKHLLPAAILIASHSLWAVEPSPEQTAALPTKSTLVSAVLPVRVVRGFTVEKYLDYFLVTKVPLSQARLSADGQELKITGPLVWDLRSLPESLQIELKAALTDFIDGRLRLPGVKVNLTEARIHVMDLETQRVADLEAAERERERIRARQGPPGPVDHGTSNPFDAMDLGPGSGHGSYNCAGLLIR